MSRLTKYIVYALVAVGTFSLFVPLSRAYVAFWARNVFIPYGIYDLPGYLAVPIATILSSSPVFIVAVAWTYLYRTKPQASKTDLYRGQIENLNEARINLLKSIDYLDELKTEISDNLRRQEELSLIVEKLESASKESAEELRKKIEAIEIVSRRKEVIKIFIGFVIGVMSSLIASAVWSMISK